MTGEAPPFWWEKPDWRALALSPLSGAYGLVAARRMISARRRKLPVPGLCVGNFTVGGAGKTPAVITLADAARAAGRQPGILSRGYGGSLSRPHVVDPAHDSARHVGDEPMLLAAHAPVAVTPDRAAGARLLIDAGCDFLLMDDGFQSARLQFDYALLVVDARRGLGNGFSIPAGPMRAPLISQLRFTDAVLAIGEGNGAEDVVRMAARAGRSVYGATIQPRDQDRLSGRRLFAFAGIGDPEKFFETLRRAGCDPVATRGFADHHSFSETDIAELEAEADAGGLQLVTTAKDAVRLRGGSPAAKALAERTLVLEIDLAFDDPRVPSKIVDRTLEAFARRQHGVSRTA